MKVKEFILALVFLLLIGGCGNAKQTLLIDSFEGDLNNQTVDFGSSENSFLDIEAEKELKVCGSQSMKLTYELKPSGYMWAARGYKLDVKGAARWLIKPEDIAWSKYNGLSLYMYGAGTKGIIALDIKDAYGEIWRFILDDTFEGWQKIICPFSKFFARSDWQPDNATVDGNLDFPIMSFQFEPRSPGKGVYYFDCLSLLRIKE